MSPRAGAPNQALIDTGVAPLRPQNQMRLSMGFGVPLLPPYVFPIQAFVYGDLSERASLSDNLNDLLVRRAGLESLWRELENEARIAKVPQVWLRPKGSFKFKVSGFKFALRWCPATMSLGYEVVL